MEEKGLLENLMNIEDVAAVTKLTPATIRKYVLLRMIPYHKIFKAVRFVPSEIEAWIKYDGNAAAVRLAAFDGGEGAELFTDDGGAALESAGAGND